MSVQAMAWAMEQRIVASPTTRLVLMCLCNYAGPDGKNAFPGTDTLSKATGLSRKSVFTHLQKLEGLGVISRGNQAVVEAHISRKDRQPTNYDIHLEKGLVANEKRGETPTPRSSRGVSDAATGCNSRPPRGVTGTPNPLVKPSIEPSKKDKASGDARSDVEKAFHNYNVAAKAFGLHPAQKLTDDRRQRIAAILKDYGPEDGLGKWNEALANVEWAPFLRGEGPSAWKADLKFLLKPDKFGCLIDGGYSDKCDAPRADTPTAKMDMWRRAVGSVVIKKGEGQWAAWLAFCLRHDVAARWWSAQSTATVPKVDEVPDAFPDVFSTVQDRFET